MKKIFFVVNHISEFKINDLEKKYLNNVDIKYGTELPYNSEKFDLNDPIQLIEFYFYKRNF